LSFEDAEQVFSGPCVTFEDDRFEQSEGCAASFTGVPLPPGFFDQRVSVK